jgi:Cu2+-exporting ATPase
VLLYSGQSFFRAAWRDVRHLQAGMDVPVALGISIAFLGSAWATFTGQGHVYYDSVAMFVFFLLTARYFELIARKRATEAGQALVHAAPAMATRLLASGEEVVPVAALRPGDRVLVRAGETIPADGTIAEGRSSVDESLITGESRPIAKGHGAAVIGGSINIESPLQVEVVKTGDDTVLAAILRLLDRAQTQKPRLSQMADRVASRFVLGVLLLASAVAIYWWQHDPARWLAITVAVLVVTCPCALSLATPVAMTAATGSLTRLGFLITRGHVLETLARATHFVFDKTGTLTAGRLRLVHTHTFNIDNATAIGLAAALEAHSEHPIARAITRAATGTSATASDVESTPGGGMVGRIHGARHALGNAGFVAAVAGLDPASLRLPQGDSGDGETLIWLARDGEVLAAFTLSDVVRPGALEAIDQLKRAGKTVVLLTGDHAPAARKLARELGIDTLAWELKPQDKLDYVEALQRDGAIVVMVGDGVNDAPVLAAAHVSVAMGSGTQIAAATADSILLSQQLPHLAQATAIARRTLRVIGQNLSWAVLYNLVALPLAAIGLIAPWMAAIGMSASSLVVVANALRLTRSR